MLVYRVLVFCDGQLYREQQYRDWAPFAHLEDIPKQSLIYFPVLTGMLLLSRTQWFRSDFTPILDEAVPAELKAWVLLLL